MNKKTNNFNAISSKYIHTIDKNIEDFFSDKIKNAEYEFIKQFYPVLREFCLREGKRIRPLLLIISYSGYKRGIKQTDKILRIASVLEIMHSFLLVQDDIIDRADLRRGDKTVHVTCAEKYSRYTKNKNIGNDIALILADVLFANAIEILSAIKIKSRIKDKFINLFALTYEFTAWGQILDTLNTMPREIDVNSSNPLFIYTLKTAYYTLYYPILMGYILSGRDNEHEKNLIKEFAVPLGLAFQIRDDLHGYLGDEEKIYKSPDSDITEGKYTFLAQSALLNMKANQRAKFISVLMKDKKNQSDIKYIKDSIIKNKAIEASKARLYEYAEASKHSLSRLNINSDQKQVLYNLVELITKID